MLPPEIIREIINLVSFEVLCAFALTSKGYLTYCKKIALKFLKKEVSCSYRGNFIVSHNIESFPNGKRHGLILEKEDYNYSYNLYVFGRKLIKKYWSKGPTEVIVYPLNSLPIFTSIYFNGYNEAGFKFLLTNMYCPNLFSVKFELSYNVKIGMYFWNEENMRMLYDQLTNFDIVKYINERRQNIIAFTYKSCNKYEFRLNRDQLSIDFKNGRSFYKTGQVKSKDIERIKARVEPEIFAAIRPWLGPDLK